MLQSRSSSSAAALVEFCGSPSHKGANPSDKVVKNLFTFLCQDTAINPIFKPTSEGILSLKDEKSKKAVKGVEEEETEEQISMRIMRRGALLAFERMAARFGAGLFDRVGKFWEGISVPLITAFDGMFKTLYVLGIVADVRSECGRDRRVLIGQCLFRTRCNRRSHLITSHRPLTRHLTASPPDHLVPLHHTCFAIKVLVNQDHRGQVPSCSLRCHDGRRDEEDGR